MHNHLFIFSLYPYFGSFFFHVLSICAIVITNSMVYGTQRFNLHSQGLSNNLYPDPNQPNSLYWFLFLWNPFWYCPPIYLLKFWKHFYSPPFWLSQSLYFSVYSFFMTASLEASLPYIFGKSLPFYVSFPYIFNLSILNFYFLILLVLIWKYECLCNIVYLYLNK